ncbi:MAG: putative DNA binding domain-containing protein [Candidatus Marinimicrobia bacterium]|nr:putative DNA binding domain-containing protein [Candidatus Neomarinimicrobiota bacterium]
MSQPPNFPTSKHLLHVTHCGGAAPRQSRKNVFELYNYLKLTMNKLNLTSILELGEGQFIEFKENLDKGFAKELVAFANASGGVIYIGINDNNRVEGINFTNKIRSQIQDIAYNCDPSLIVSMDQIDNILAVSVSEGKNKPYSCSQGFFMRMGANSQKMSRDEILTLAIKSGKIRYDEQICTNFDWHDFDDEKFEYFLKLAKISNNLPRKEILKNLRVLTKDGMTNAGVLYFSKSPYQYIISSKIRCIHFNEDDRVDILDKKIVDRGIIGNIEFAVEYLRERIPVRYEIKELKRDEFPEYPLQAYREAVVNAVIHFDYFLGDTIAVEKLKSKIIVNNKGELLFPESEFGKRSESRNRLLSDLLARTDLMEKAGTGIKRISDACNKNNNKVSFKFSDVFWVNINTNISDKVPDNLSFNQEKIVKLIKSNKKISMSQMAEKLNISKRKILDNMNKLKERGLIKRTGSPKTGYWEIL